VRIPKKTRTSENPRAMESNLSSSIAGSVSSLYRSPATLLAAALAVILFSGATALAVSPAPDGGYPGGNTAEGQSALFSSTTGTYNTAVGYLSLWSDTAGQFNTAIGAGALLANVGNSNGSEGVENTATGAGALLSNTTGEQNTANGAFALFYNTQGAANTAIGDQALFSNTTGILNTAVGGAALFSNTTGMSNTAIGVIALADNTIGNNNTGTGFKALQNNTIGSDNTANGFEVLFSNTSGGHNTAAGAGALFANTTGDQNTAFGDSALVTNTTGATNTATGLAALHDNTTGTANTAFGVHSLESNVGGNNNTAIGAGALFQNTGGSFNVALGGGAGSSLTTGDNNIDIGYNVVGVAGEANTIRIGNTNIGSTFVRGISGVTIPAGTAVIVAADGQLGTMTSSARFKQEIKPMNKASEALFSLRPVTFRYKKEIDPNGIQQFGLVAEEVEKISPGLVVRDQEGKVNSVRYEQVNAMLLNEFLKEHCKVEKLEQARADDESEMSELRNQIKVQAAAIQQLKDEFDLRGVSTGIGNNR
jgi:trimeric autotransporter adhesin